MITLHAYILRELLKTFGLVVAALTALFTMGGGIYNVMRYEGVTTADIFRVMPMLIPIVVTLTMPMSALFTATIVYGRLAADNEFVACRSAGINVHRLFIPAFLLSVFVAVFTTLFANYVIPNFMKRLDQMARTNLCDIAAARLKQKGSIAYEGKYFLTAESADVVAPETMAKKGFPTGPGWSYLLVGAPTFLQLEKEEVVRFTSGKWGLCQFDTREYDPLNAVSRPKGPGDKTGDVAVGVPQSPVRVTLIVNDARDFEVGKRGVHVEQQSITYPFPMKIPNKPSFASLDRLFEWKRQPWLYEEVADSVESFLRKLKSQLFYLDCLAQLDPPGRTLTLSDEAARAYLITTASAKSEGKDGRILMTDVQVSTLAPGTSKPMRYRAPRAELIARPGSPSQVELRLIRTAQGAVLEYNPRSEDADKPVEKLTLSIDNLQFPTALDERMADFTPQRVVRSEPPLISNPQLEDDRESLRKGADKFQRKVAAMIHFRLGFSSSVLVTILMGAALGVIFRGGRALAAFGLAFVPFSIVAILMVMGQQLGGQANTQYLGPWITWGGLGAMAIIDSVILWVGVKR